MANRSTSGIWSDFMSVPVRTFAFSLVAWSSVFPNPRPPSPLSSSPRNSGPQFPMPARPKIVTVKGVPALDPVWDATLDLVDSESTVGVEGVVSLPSPDPSDLGE